MIQHYTGVPVLGAVQHDERMTIAERHLGLIPSNEAQGARERVDEIAARIAAQVDLDRLLAVARAGAAACPAPGPRCAAPRRSQAARRCAWASRAMPRSASTIRATSTPCARPGAELVSFDALHAEHLPQVDGVFIGGGFPETHMEALAANTNLRRELHDAIEAGLPAYAECGGLMYLARGIEWNGRRAGMVGVIPGRHRHAQPAGRARLRAPARDRPRLVAAAAAPQAPLIHAHEFHYSSVENLAPGVEFAYEVERGHGIDGRHDGIVHKNLLASFAHLRDVAGNPWARRFVDFVRSCRHAA